jgi:hypothetical protein
MLTVMPHLRMSHPLLVSFSFSILDLIVEAIAHHHDPARVVRGGLDNVTAVYS